MLLYGLIVDDVLKYGNGLRRREDGIIPWYSVYRYHSGEASSLHSGMYHYPKLMTHA